MSISRWMDKEGVVHIHNGILLSCKKECIGVNSNEVDKTGTYYTEQIKSERGRQILYINTYIRNLERRYQQSYMQRRHKCKEQTFELSGRRQGWNDLREKHWNMYITICKIDDQCKFNAWSRAPKADVLEQPRRIGWRRRWEGAQDGGTRVYMWQIHVDIWQKPSQNRKVIILQLK